MKKRLLIFLILLLGSVALIMKFNDLGKPAVGYGTFAKYDISETLQSEMKNSNTWGEDCPVDIERLKLLRLSYIDFAGKDHHDGKMIVLDTVADQTLTIFKELFENKFPIAKIRLLSEYNGDDIESMTNNNTSSFNCRKIAGQGEKWSMHAYGLAIDINPVQNPFIDSHYEEDKESLTVLPPRGMHYLNRANLRPGMVENIINPHTNETVIDIFKKYGFTIWGGSWNEPIDWHHFQIPREEIEKYVR